MSLETEIQTLIAGVAREGALTAQAIKQFDELTNRVKHLEESCNKLDQELKDERKLKGALQTELSLTSARLKDAEARLETYRKQEFTFELNNRMMAFEQDRRIEMRSILSDVFRNVEIHRSIAKSVFTPVEGIPPNQYNTMGMAGSVHQNRATDEVTEIPK